MSTPPFEPESEFPAAGSHSASAILYARPLSAGGYVAIEAHQPAGSAYHACVYVERRTDPARRHGHAPPIVAQYAGPTRLSVMHELYRVAADDDLVARGMAQWMERKRPRS